MGEYYWGEATLTLPEPLPLNVFDDDFDAEVWVDNHLVERFGTLEGMPPVQQAEYDAEAERLTGLLQEIASWDEGAEQVDVDEEARTVTLGGIHSYGIAYWTENTDLEETCRANGIGYDLRDEGKYEIPGEQRVWKPTMPGSVTRSHSPEGAVLSVHQADAMWKEVGGDAALFGQLVRQYFHAEGE